MGSNETLHMNALHALYGHFLFNAIALKRPFHRNSGVRVVGGEWKIIFCVAIKIKKDKKKSGSKWESNPGRLRGKRGFYHKALIHVCFPLVKTSSKIISSDFFYTYVICFGQPHSYKYATQCRLEIAHYIFPQDCSTLHFDEKANITLAIHHHISMKMNVVFFACIHSYHQTSL